ncbi:MAG: hypothetical protein LLG04_16995 [Parachlamydia sp.]|nr:hypothetical protein [Parachlamydia sp.]
MNPISPLEKGHLPVSAAATDARVVTPAERASHAAEVNSCAAASPAAPMSWKNRGEYHLNRKELKPAVEALDVILNIVLGLLAVLLGSNRSSIGRFQRSMLRGS